MKPIKIPQIVCLRGKEAVKALSTFVNELERQRGKELTDNQVDALIRIANELITSIEAQIQTKTTIHRSYLNPSHFIKRIVSPLTKFIC